MISRGNIELRVGGEGVAVAVAVAVAVHKNFIHSRIYTIKFSIDFTS